MHASVRYLHEPSQGRHISSTLPEQWRQQRLKQRRHVECREFARVQLYELCKNLEHIWMELLYCTQFGVT